MRASALALAMLTALGACAQGGLATRGEGPTGAWAPSGTRPGAEAVDGLTVGHRLMAAGEYDLAIRAYERAAADEGLTVDVISAVGSANLKLGRLHQAERLLRRATELDPNFAPAWNNLGVVLMEKGEYAEAARVFRIAYGLDHGKSDSIRENLRLALAKIENPSYSGTDNNNFALMRRGAGDYLLLTRS